ncbi:MAG: serine hydrolase [Desulfomonilaceae bacterium]|nr:serine hydrolase [Desulfomonilaceae bacterium]
MFLRLVQFVVGLCVLSGGIVFAIEPVYTGTSMAELMSKADRGHVVIPAPERSAPSSRASSTRDARHVSYKSVSSRPVLPPIPAVNGGAEDTNRRPPSRPERPFRMPVLPELGLGAAIVPASHASPQPSRPAPSSPNGNHKASPKMPQVNAKALYCVDFSSNRVVLAENITEPLPIASITKLLTAMIVIDEMDLNRVLTVPPDIREVPRHRVGLRPGDRLTVSDVLHGMLIQSGNDCAEVIARAYPKGGREGFLEAMNRKAKRIGAKSVRIHTPSGLDRMMILGRTGGRDLSARKPNTASARDVAVIAQHAFQYPLIREIATTKHHTMRTRNERPRTYNLVTNDKLLSRKLPVAGAKTGFTNLAGRCIVALFKDRDREHMVVVLNTPSHFKAAEKIYRWASSTF